MIQAGIAPLPLQTTSGWRLPSSFWAIFGCALTILVAGCASTPTYYEYRPTVIERAQARQVSVDLKPDSDGKRRELRDALRQIDKGTSTVKVAVSDQDIVLFSDNVKNMLRRKTVISRITRYTTATTQVLLTGAAVATVPFAPASVPITLGAIGTIVPSLQDVFQAGKRAIAYQQAVTMIETAQERYLETEIGRDGGVPADKMTREGLELLRQTTASVRVTEETLNGMIPDLHTLQTAHGVAASSSPPAASPAAKRSN